MAKLVLASASSGRLGLMEVSGLKPDIIAPMDIDETPLKNEKPEELVVRLALEKARQAALKHPKCFIIAADTVGASGRKIIGKADSEKEARKMLEMVAGRRHKVHSGVSVISPEGKQIKKLVTTTVKIKKFAKSELDWYLASGEWKGKSGCYSVQGRGNLFLEYVNGSYSNVVGLPMYETLNMLSGLGYRLP